jgi:kumamolisin
MVNSEDYWQLPGSFRSPILSPPLSSEGFDQDFIEVTIWLRGKQQMEATSDPSGAAGVGSNRKSLREEASRIMKLPLRDRKYYSRQELDTLFPADTEAWEAVTRFAEKHGLEILEGKHYQRLVELKVPLDKVEPLFGTQLAIYELPSGQKFRGRNGPIQLPKADFSEREKKGILGLFGLDNRPQARSSAWNSPAPQLCRSTFLSTSLDTSDPPYPPQKYAYVPKSQLTTPPPVPSPPPPLIGVLVMGLVGSFDSYGFMTKFPQGRLSWVQASTVTMPRGDANSELEADLWIIFKCIPDANVLVLSTDATEQGWIRGLNAAGIQDPMPAVLNVSWGWPETDVAQDTGIWTDDAFAAIETVLATLVAQGMTVCVASGDKGSQVFYPGTSAYVLSCGGTNFADGSWTQEKVWTGNGASGGGQSQKIQAPDWQKESGILATGYPVDLSPAEGYRLVPDVAAYAVYPEQNQTDGTSCAAPLWTAALASANRQLAANHLTLAGNISALLYMNDSDLQDACNDVVLGTNKIGAQAYFDAGPKWDACTGFGTPNVQNVIMALLSGARPRNPGLESSPKNAANLLTTPV